MKTLPIHSHWLLASVSLAVLLASLATSIGNVSLPSLAQSFNASFAEIQWVVLSYLLSLTALAVSVGKVGDIMGHRRLLLAGILVFTLAAVLCGVASTLGMLVAARAVQGAGSAVILTLALAVASQAVAAGQTGRAMGLLGTMSAIGTALGPALGGFLIAALGWRAIFLFNLPLGILAFVLVWRHLPDDRRPTKVTATRFDYPGIVLLALTLAAYALSATLGRGRFDSLNGVLLLAAAAGVALLVRVEARAAAPVIPLPLLRDPVRAASLAANALVSTVLMATLVVGPFYLAHGLGLNAALVGLVLAVGPVVAALMGVPAGRLVDRIGVARASQAGLVGIGAGSLTLAVMPAAFGLTGYVGAIVALTASYALFQSANNAAVMQSAGMEQRGVLSGLLNLSRNLGLITGAAVMGAVFATATGGLTATSATHAGLHTTFAVAAALIFVAIGISYRRNAPVEPRSSRRGAKVAAHSGLTRAVQQEVCSRVRLAPQPLASDLRVLESEVAGVARSGRSGTNPFRDAFGPYAPAQGYNMLPISGSTFTRISFTKSDWLIPTGLIALSLVPALAGTVRVVQLAGGAEITPENARFLAARGSVILHIVSAVLFSVFGAFQFSSGLRRRSLPWHRATGWLMVPCGLLAALSGLWLAHVRGASSFTGTAPADYDGTAIYYLRLLVGVAMAASLVLATTAILKRDVTRHRAWMIRGYALGLGAGTQVFTHLPWFLFPAVHSELARTLCMAAGWAINAAVAEWLIARSSSTNAANATAGTEPRFVAVH